MKVPEGAASGSIPVRDPDARGCTDHHSSQVKTEKRGTPERMAHERPLDLLSVHSISSMAYCSHSRTPQRISNSCGVRRGTGKRT